MNQQVLALMRIRHDLETMRVRIEVNKAAGGIHPEAAKHLEIDRLMVDTKIAQVIEELS